MVINSVSPIFSSVSGYITVLKGLLSVYPAY